ERKPKKPQKSSTTIFTNKSDAALKILFCLNNFPEVSETFILNQIEGLTGLGHDVSVLALRASNANQSKIYNHLMHSGKIHSVGSPKNKLKKYLFTLWLWLTHCRKKGAPFSKTFLKSIFQNSPERFGIFIKLTELGKFDAAIAHYGTVANIFIDFKQLNPSARFLVFFHGFDMSATVKKYGPSIYKDIFHTADVFLPISKHWRNALLALGAPEQKLEVFHMGINPNHFAFRFRRADPGTPMKILSVARMVDKKGLDDALKAVALANKTHTISYTIIGDGPNKEKILCLIRSLRLESSVALLGSIPNEAVRLHYEASDIFLLPSKTDTKSGDQEGIPVVLMEAMAQGIPVISTTHSGIPELIIDGETGWLAPENNPDALYQKITEIIRNPEEANRRVQRAREKVIEEFNINRLTIALNRILNAER
ncbi:MAG TPA: glycosyltransferase, partial [Candidatus Bathyarchaeia archaeon]|nr:glycosyltransferase [Candidatus Bathyarchaeia archaeon]